MMGDNICDNTGLSVAPGDMASDCQHHVWGYIDIALHCLCHIVIILTSGCCLDSFDSRPVFPIIYFIYWI